MSMNWGLDGGSKLCIGCSPAPRPSPTVHETEKARSRQAANFVRLPDAKCQTSLVSFTTSRHPESEMSPKRENCVWVGSNPMLRPKFVDVGGWRCRTAGK